MYCTPIWRIRKVVFKAQVADTLIKKQETEIRQLTGALAAADQSAIAAREATDNAIKAGKALEETVVLTEQKVKIWERLAKKWRRIAVFSGVVVVAELAIIIGQAVGD